MKEVKLVEALIANDFEVKQGDTLDIYYNKEYLLSLEGTGVVGIADAVNELSEYKYGQLLHIVKKYQDLIHRESVVAF